MELITVKLNYTATFNNTAMRRIFLLSTMMIIAGSMAMAQNNGTATNTGKPEGTKSVIKFTEVVYNFGEVAYGSDVSHIFKFTNVSNTPVAIKDVGTSCGCTTPGYSKEPVAPGKTGSVTAKYDSTRPGGFNKTLTVFVNDEQIRLTITGTVKAPSSENKTVPK